MLFYVIGTLVSLLIAGLTVAVIRELLTLATVVRAWNPAKPGSQMVRLDRMCYLARDRDGNGEIEFRRTPYPSKPPCPTWDGSFRSPWGW